MLKSAIGSWGWKRKCVLALGFLVSTGAWATPDFHADFNNGWVIGGLDSEIEVDGSPWTKFLAVPVDGLTTTQTPLTLTESLKLTSGKNLISWPERIVGPTGWAWASTNSIPTANDPLIQIEVITDSGNIDNTCNIGPSTDVLTCGFTLVSDTLLEFNFDLALPGGTTAFWLDPTSAVFITITKSLICTPNLGQEARCFGPIEIQENPAPEPGTLLLLAGGLAALGGLRRRRYS